MTRAAISLFALLALWALASALADSEMLPSPRQTAAVLTAEMASGEMPRHIAATLARTAAAFLVAMSVGGAIGALMGRAPRLDRWLDPWLIFFLNLPALVVIVLCYLWIGLTEAAVVAAVALNKIPMVAVTMREGARALEPRYFALARAYHLSAAAVLRRIVLPQLAPYFAASARSGLALIWKIVLLVELLGRSDGVGFQIHLFFQLFDIAGILAYAAAFIAVMLAIEWLFMRPLEVRANRWRNC